jgi:rhamnose utilization protein RhaD (predicted bifunctional aldolase and dehydrogenase)
MRNSGSDGGMTVAKAIAEFYQANGMAALAIGLFKTQQTGKYLDRVPLEYIERAIRWLKAGGYEKIGVDAISKGTEYALIAAEKFHDISCVIVRTPSHFLSEGLGYRAIPFIKITESFMPI